MSNESFWEADRIENLVARHIMGLDQRDVCPAYAADPEATKAVMATMREHGFEVTSSPITLPEGGPGYRVEVKPVAHQGEGLWSTAQPDAVLYAICLLSLKALGVQVSDTPV